MEPHENSPLPHLIQYAKELGCVVEKCANSNALLVLPPRGFADRRPHRIRPGGRHAGRILVTWLKRIRREALARTAVPPEALPGLTEPQAKKVLGSLKREPVQVGPSSWRNAALAELRERIGA